MCIFSSVFPAEQYFEHANLSRSPVPPQGEIGISAQGLFGTKFNSEQLLFEAFFDAMRIFRSVFPAKQYFEHANLSRCLVPPEGEIDISARELFCTKFISEQLLFEAFFDVIHIFDSVEP